MPTQSLYNHLLTPLPHSPHVLSAHIYIFTEEDLFACSVTPQWEEFMKFQIQRARDYYAEAGKGIAMLAPDARFAVRASLDLYRYMFRVCVSVSVSHVSVSRVSGRVPEGRRTLYILHHLTPSAHQSSRIAVLS